MSLKRHLREIILGVVLVAVLVYLFLPSAPQTGDLLDDGLGRETVTGTAASILNGPAVDLALLTQQLGNYDGGGRNLFDYGHIVPPPLSAEEQARLAAAAAEAKRIAHEQQKELEAKKEELRLAALERQKRLAEEAANRPKPPPAQPPKPIPPKFPYRFIGVLGESDSKIAIFLDDKDFLLAMEGEDVKEDFRIVRIGYDTLQIGYTDPQFKEESRILQMGRD